MKAESHPNLSHKGVYEIPGIDGDFDPNNRRFFSSAKILNQTPTFETTLWMVKINGVLHRIKRVLRLCADRTQRVLTLLGECEFSGRVFVLKVNFKEREGSVVELQPS